MTDKTRLNLAVAEVRIEMTAQGSYKTIRFSHLKIENLEYQPECFINKERIINAR